MKKVEILKKKRVFDDFFKVDEALLTYEKFDGRMSDTVRRLNFERGDAAAALVFNRQSQKVILVEQFRYPTHESDANNGWITEVVAGIVEKGEDPKETIKREIHEETGYRVKEAELVYKFYLSPGGSSERIFLYYAEVTDNDRVSQGGGVACEHEDLQLKEFTIDQLFTHLDAGGFVDAKTIIALMWLKRKLGPLRV